jgi:hypothetical protein
LAYLSKSRLSNEGLEVAGSVANRVENRSCQKAYMTPKDSLRFWLVFLIERKEEEVAVPYGS